MKNKYRGGVGKELLAVFLVIFSLFFLLAIGGGITRFYSGDDSLTLASMARRILNGESIIQVSGGERKLLTSYNEKSQVELGLMGKNQEVKLLPMDQAQWPKEASGGLYHLEAGGELKTGINFKMTLAETPSADFALGYWYPDTKQWEWLPTAKLDEKTFETILPHASVIGGASGGACSSMPKGSENIQMYNEIKANMSRIQIDQQTGEAASQNDASWKPVWDTAKEMTDKAINDYCKNKNLTTEYDFYAAWELIQCLGFSSLNDRFENAWRNKCEEPEKSRQYKIDQSDDYKANFHLNLGWFYKQNSNFKGTVYYFGNPVGVAPKGKSAWRTNWKVRSFVDGTGTANQTGHLQDEDFYYDLRALNTSFNTTDSYESTFSLENIKEGESFPIYQVRSGAYTSRMSGPNGTLQWRSGSMNYNGTIVMQDTQTIAPGYSATYSAVLLKDMGDDGAIIAFSNEMKLTPEQEKAFRDVMRIQRESGLPVISDMWTAPGKLNSNIMQTEGQAKPWRIVPIGQSDESKKGEDDWKANENDLSNSQKIQNPYDRNNDNVPDLAPLPTAQDRNADGISDNQQ